MNGKSICIVCKKEFKWRRAQGQPTPKYCSMRCYYPERTPEFLEKLLRELYEYHVVKKDGCWDWKASLDSDGYGQITGARELKISKAHRASWTIHRGPIPEGMSVLHKCDNRRCTNPDHLFLGKPLENSRDMVYKGRQTKGVKNGGAKLTEEQVKEIRKQSSQGIKVSYLAEKYDVCRDTIWRVKAKKKYWKHISE